MIAVDTNILIYLLNAHPDFGPKAIEVVRSRQPKVASELVFAEIFSSPKLQAAEVQRHTRTFLESLDITYARVDKQCLLLAGQLRRAHARLALADALHIANALQSGAQTFVTNDQDLTKLNIDGLTIKPL